LNKDGRSANNSINLSPLSCVQLIASMEAAILKSCATTASVDWSIEETSLSPPSQNPAHAATSGDVWRRVEINI
jgi:predicted signal transduction protein with EAL and GGDEF domain